MDTDETQICQPHCRLDALVAENELNKAEAVDSGCVGDQPLRMSNLEAF